jgi:hypothetical protein
VLPPAPGAWFDFGEGSGYSSARPVGIESVHWLRDTAYGEDAGTGYTRSGPQVMATFR